MKISKRVNGADVTARAIGSRKMAVYVWNRKHLLVAAALSTLIASCATGPTPLPFPTVPPITTPPVTQTGAISYKTSGHGEMDVWRADFSERAIAKGHDRAIVESVLTGISPLNIWLGKSVKTAASIGDQAEFSKPIWDYLRVPLGNTRVNNGRDKLAADPAMFDQLEARFGVDRQVLVSIWGMETSYGGYIGDFDAANALANMAVEGRRRSFAEGELYALMKVLKRGAASRDELIAGYAGAMGQTQFMPSTYIAYAADFENDGKIDVWKNKADALASAANYLSVSGYVKGEPWGIEVIAPSGFDYAMADGEDRRIETWQAAGLSPIIGGDYPVATSKYAELWLPAGAEGPKYLLMKNFKAFKKYNNADSYAFAVGMLADAVAGDTIGPVAAWPKHLKPLSVADIKLMQAKLNALGFPAGPADGIPGRRTKGALQGFQRSRGIVADGYPTKAMLDLLNNAGNAQVSSAGPSPAN
jgi:lytic murein transglycosylase